MLAFSMECSCTPGRSCLPVSKEFENKVVINHSVKQIENKSQYHALSSEIRSHMPGQSCEFSKYKVRQHTHTYFVNKHLRHVCMHVSRMKKKAEVRKKFGTNCFQPLRNYWPNGWENIVSVTNRNVLAWW